MYLILHCGFIYLALFVLTDTCIEREQAETAANRHQMACEAFGDGMLPQLQSAVYKVKWGMLVLKVLKDQNQRNKGHNSYQCQDTKVQYHYVLWSSELCFC